MILFTVPIIVKVENKKRGIKYERYACGGKVKRRYL